MDLRFVLSMIRFVSIILSIFVVFCLFVPVSADGALPPDFSLCDFSDLGVPSIPCLQITNIPILDGVISSGEYPSFVTMRPGAGLCLSSEKEVDANGVFQENCVTSDGDYFYVALRITAPSQFSFGYSHKDMGKVYSLSVNLGMTPGEDPASRFSLLHNKYYFDTETFACVGVSGYRVYHTPEGASRFSLQISSLKEIHRENGFVDAKGDKWTASHYQKNAFFTVEIRGEECIYTAEFRIPVGDVLLSVSPDLKDTAFKIFKEKSGVLCGSFSTDFSCPVSKESILCGIYLENSCTYLNDGRSWYEAIADKYPNADSFLDEATFLSIPFYLSGEIPTKEMNPLKESGIAVTSGAASKETSPKPESTERTPKDSDNSSKTQNAYSDRLVLPFLESESNLDSEGDENLFSHLPDEDDCIPEDTQIVDLSDEEEKDGEGENTLLGKIILLITGLLLFASVMIFAVVLSRKERKEKAKNEKRENMRKKSGKKSQNMKKK